MTFEYSMGGKWVELLKQIAPGVARAAVIRDAGSPTGMAQFGVIQAMAPSLNVEVTPVNMPNVGEIERSVAAFARSPNGGLILTASALAIAHGELIIGLAAQHKLPAVYLNAPSSPPAAWLPMDPISPPCTGKRPATSIAFSRARNLLTCRCKCRTSTRR